MATSPATSSSNLGAAVANPSLPPHSENVEEELVRIKHCLDAVFSPNQTAPPVAINEWWSQRAVADRYLTSFQRNTTVSWLVCDRLLQEENGEKNTMQLQQRRFFAAQTLHTKCRTDLRELPVESWPSLRDSLLAHLQRYGGNGRAGSSHGNNTVLTTRLALCVSALAVQMGWCTIIHDLLSNPSQQHLVMLVLRVLPEECASDRLWMLEEENRFRMRDHLVSTSQTVLQFLHASMQQASPSERESLVVLETLHTWIRYVPVPPHVLQETPLLSGSVQALTQPAYMEHAADVVVEVLRMYPSHHPANQSLCQHLIPLLSQLPLDDALRSDDVDVWRAYCRVVTEMGESYTSWILSPQYQQASTLVDWVLQCSAISNGEIACMTLHFWYNLVQDLEAMEPLEWRQVLVDFYTPQLLQLMDLCVSNLMRFPDDYEELPADAVEDLQRHRFYVADTMVDSCRLLGGQVVLQRIGSHWQRHVQQAQQQLARQPQSPDGRVVSGGFSLDWQGLESCLACMTAIHAFVPCDERQVLPSVFALIPQLPADNRPLRMTACQVIGKYASWLARGHTDVSQPLLPYLAQGLSHPSCASAAAVSIRELCECSNPNTFAIAEPVVSLYQDLVTPQPGRLALADELQILQGVCQALSRQAISASSSSSSANGKEYLTRLAQPMGMRLAACVADATATTPGRIMAEVDRLTTVIQYLTTTTSSATSSSSNETHPLIELVQSIWNLLDTASVRFPTDNMLAEKVCRLHKHALRTCGKDAYAPMLEALMQQLVKSFERSHQSPYLYAASICITEYGPDPSYSSGLYDMVTALTTAAFSFLRTLEDFTNHPDVVEEFFYLMGRMLSYCPDPLVTSPLFQSLFQCATVGMQLDHHGANKGTLKFLEHTISYGLSLREQNKPNVRMALEHVLSQQGPGIVENLTRAMMGDLPAYSNQIPEILWKLNLLCPGLLAQWLTAAFASATALPDRVKNDFMGALDTGLARDEFSLAVRAFQSACDRERRFRKTQRRS